MAPLEKTTTLEIAPPRVQLSHLLIDVDFFDKPTVRALEFKHGKLAALLYVRWLMLMSRASNALVTRDSLQSLGEFVLDDPSKFDEVLSYCLKTRMLTNVKDDLFTNERVIKDQESCALKREQATQRQKKYREKMDQNSNALVTRLPDTDTDTECIKKGVQGETETILLPKHLDTPKHKDALHRWVIYNKKLGKDLGAIQVQTLVANWALRPANELIEGINQSIERGYKKIIYQPQDTFKNSNGHYKSYK